MKDKIFRIMVEELHDHTTGESCQTLLCIKYKELTGEYPFVIFNRDHTSKVEK